MENNLYFKRSVKDITSHINYSLGLKSIIKENKKFFIKLTTQMKTEQNFFLMIVKKIKLNFLILKIH